jgi:DNA-directed RNA polymerase subunit alpha
MSNIALPKKISFHAGDNANTKKVVVEPLHPGYGTTLGNAIRRVLLSSIPGTAVIGVKIEGADHEFMALPNIKEDVLEIILNLKNLNLKIHTDEIVKLELEAHGEKEVKAKDIKGNADVEIANKDLTIAHITDMAGKLNMEIFASRGMGYETIENRENRKKEIGYIEIDSIFSPVRAVGIDVENTRVGKMTNWDKLTLTITTDGTLSPEEVFDKSVAILIEQFNSLVGLAKGETVEAETETEENVEEAIKETKDEE